MSNPASQPPSTQPPGQNPLVSTLYAYWPQLAFLLVWFVTWAPVILGRDQLYIRDLTFYTQPMKSDMMARFRAGEFPFWSEHLSGGMPFFAELSHQVLYPFNLLFFVTPTLIHGITWFVILHSLLAFPAAYYLARVMGLARWPSVVAAVCYGLSGYVISITDNVNYLPVVVWGPLALATFIRGCNSRLPRYGVMTSIGLCLMFLAGDTFNPMLLCVFLALYALLYWRAHANQPRVLSFLTVHSAISMGLFGLLSAMQLLPSLELVSISVRQIPLTFQEITLWSFPPQRLIEFILPFFYGTKYPTPQFIGMFLYPEFREPWADSIYVGLIPVVLAGLAIAFRKAFGKPWLIWFWVISGAIALLIGFGKFAFYFPSLLDLVPILQSHRYLEKSVYWPTLSLCMLAGIGISLWPTVLAWLQRQMDAKTTVFRLALTAGGIAGFIVIFWKIPTDLWIWTHAMERSMDWREHFFERAPHVQRLLLHSLTLLLALIATLWIPTRFKHNWLKVLCVMAMLDLALVHIGHTPTVPTRLITHLDKPWAYSVIERAQAGYNLQNKLFRVFYDDKEEYQEDYREPLVLRKLEDGYQVADIPDTFDYHWIYRVVYNQHRLLFNYGFLSDLAYLNGRFAPLQPLEHKRGNDLFLKYQPDRLMTLNNVRYIMTPIEPLNTDWDPTIFRELDRHRGLNVRVLENTKVLPRAYLADEPIFNPDPMVYKVLTTGFNRPEYQVELAAPEHVGLPLPSPGATVGASVTIQHPNPETYDIAVNNLRDAAYLVLTEGMYPGWRVTVDGQDSPLLYANHRVMATPVPAGSHQVRFTYYPSHFDAGLMLTLLGLALAGFGLWYPRPLFEGKARP